MNFLIGLITFLIVVAGVVVFLSLPWQGLIVLLILVVRPQGLFSEAARQRP